MGKTGEDSVAIFGLFGFVRQLREKKLIKIYLFIIIFWKRNLKIRKNKEEILLKRQKK